MSVFRTRTVAVCAAALAMGAACTNLDALSLQPYALGPGGRDAGGAQPSAGGRDGGDAQIGNESGGNGGSGGRAESGGTLGAGAAGGVRSGGVAGATGGSPQHEAGVDANEAGAGDADGGTIIVGPPGSDYDDPVFVPWCTGNQANNAKWDNAIWEPPSDLVSARIFTDACCALYATQAKWEIAVLAWDLTTAPFGTPTGWWGWQCFDAVPKIKRLAALNLSNGSSEEYALSSASDLWVRREYMSAGRGPWQHVARPAGIRELRDIHAFRSDPFRPELLALSEGAVFIRGRVTDDPYSTFADWHEVGSVQATRVCGGYAGGQVEIYAITTDGELAITRGYTPDSDGGVFSAFDTVPGPAPASDGGALQRFTELDCASDENGALSVFAVTDSGDLFRGSHFAADWARIGGNLPIGATAIAAQSATPRENLVAKYRNDVTLFATVKAAIYRAVLPAPNDAGPIVTLDWKPVVPSHDARRLDGGPL